MASRYEIFCTVIESGSFTKAAQQLSYSQSAISQAIKSLENEIGTTLLNRSKDGIALTPDGEQFYPYIQAVFAAQKALGQKRWEMQGLENSVITIGTFTSVSRNLLPPLMLAFKKQYPHVHFVLTQGEYTSIASWIQNGKVDFGFVNADAASALESQKVYQDELLAVLPPNHALANQLSVALQQLAKEPFILLDEGDHSVALKNFRQLGLTPRIEYTVYDDYTILSMIRQNLGVSLMYRLVLTDMSDGLCVRPVAERPQRTINLAWRNWDTMPLAARRFAKFILKEMGAQPQKYPQP